MRVRFVNVNGARTRCLYEGKGYPVVLLHGVGLSADIWLRNIDRLAEDFSVYAPDLPGHGFSAPIDLTATPLQAALVEHLSSLADVLGLQRFAVAGSSFGGLLAGLWYFRMPRRIEKLIIIGSGAAFNAEEEMAAVLPQVYENGIAAINDPTLESCRRRLANICYDPSSVAPEVLLSQLTSYALPEIVEAYKQTLAAMTDVERSRPYQIRERLAQITVPTHIIWGREDRRGFHRRAVEATAQISRADMVTFERCGHLPFMEHPDLFNESVLAFLHRDYTAARETHDVRRKG
jgi:2-hydroxy-6-oxonona-2,4-dienedioate hydrolase